MRRWLREAASYGELRRTPYGMRPAIIFVLISTVATFDGAIFGIVLPDIFADLEIDLGSTLTALNLAAFFVTLVSIGLAYFLDRTRRVPFVGLGAIASGLFSLTTAVSSTSATLGLSRAADNIGSTAGNIPAFSLLADYYPPESRGKVFSLVGVLGRFGGLVAPISIGLLVVATATNQGHGNWRLPFLITGPAMVLIGILTLLLLREPIRGYMERRALGASEEVARKPEEPPSLGEAWRTTWSIRTLRRLFISDIPQVVGATIFGLPFALFLRERYGLDALGIGRIVFLVGLGSIPGGFLAGGIVDSLTKRRPQRVLLFTGALGVLAAPIFIVFALGPPLWVIAAVAALFGFFGSLLGPARSVIFAQVIPAHIRTLGLSVRVLATIPGFIVYQFVVLNNIDTIGLRGAMLAAFPFLLAGALIELSAAGLFERDMRSAQASQLAAEEYRRTAEGPRSKILVCRDVDVEYDGVQVLFGVDFDVDEGELIALLGTNGAGKSTLLRAISGTSEASSGAILFDGRDITHMPPPEIAARGLIHVPGGRGVFPGLTVRENLMLGGWLSEGGEANNRLEEAYRLFPLLQERAGEVAGMLSGGEQQMLSLAQALLSRPRLLAIDELSLGLSPALVAQLIEVVKRINEQGTTVILVEQSVNVALTLAKRAVFMEKGEVSFVGATADLLRRPDILRAVYVKGSAGLDGDRAVATLRSERERRSYRLDKARPVLEIRGVTKRFGGLLALDDVSLELREGEILGIIGPNGAGKTTLFDVIGGQQFADSGTIIFNGVDVSNLIPAARAESGLIRRFQQARIFPSLTVLENVLIALDPKLERRNLLLIAAAQLLPFVRQAERRVRLRAESLIELLGLQAYRDKFLKELSTGLRRVVDLACVMATEPKVLLLDEPSTGIAQAEAESLGPLLRRVQFETGCSILLIEHDMNVVSRLSDQLIAMDQGKVLTRGEPDVVLGDDRVVEAYLGTSREAIQRSGLLA